MNSNSNNQSLQNRIGGGLDLGGSRSSRKQAVPKKIPNKQVQAKLPSTLNQGQTKGGSPNLQSSEPSNMPSSLQQKSTVPTTDLASIEPTNTKRTRGDEQMMSPPPLPQQFIITKEDHPRFELIDELERLKKDIEDKDRLLRQREIEQERSTQLLNQFSNQIKEIQSVFEQQEAQKKVFIDSHIKTLSALEEKLRKEKRLWLNEQAIRLGRLTMTRQGTKYVEVWEEGEAFKKLNLKLKEITADKEEIERLKKNRNKQKVKKNLLPAVPTDGFSGNNAGASRASHVGNNQQQITSLLNEPSEFDLEESEFNNIDKNEQKEIYQFKLKLLENEERRIRDELQVLEKEKSHYLHEFKRVRDEESSKYNGLSSKKRYSVLAGKYLLLSLLGKGGYSEVYRGYDLESCREVACKIHHFDDSWSEQIKESYIKHALRENEIHKDLNNRRVVKQFDTVEIDHNSFCTVLELCSGPDLYFYLKQNKQIPEKEAKLIISQILSGLKYLNESKQKIIHYDLKPQNILFHNGEVKITDFGLCKIMNENDEKIELTSQGVGTYWYQAPECFEMSSSNNPPMINSKVDVWSVGVIFFEILFGQKPFGHDKSQQAILQDQTILNAREVIFPNKPQISEQCKDFIRKCLAYYQHDRYDVIEAYFSPYLRGGASSVSPNQQPAQPSSVIQAGFSHPQVNGSGVSGFQIISHGGAAVTNPYLNSGGTSGFMMRR